MPHARARNHRCRARPDGLLIVASEATGIRHEPCISGFQSRRRLAGRVVPARTEQSRGPFPAIDAVLSTSHRARTCLAAIPPQTALCRSVRAHQLRASQRIDSPRGHRERRASVQPLRQLRSATQCKRDAVRGMRTEAQQARAAVLIESISRTA